MPLFRFRNKGPTLGSASSNSSDLGKDNVVSMPEYHKSSFLSHNGPRTIKIVTILAPDEFEPYIIKKNHSVSSLQVNHPWTRRNPRHTEQSINMEPRSIAQTLAEARRNSRSRSRSSGTNTYSSSSRSSSESTKASSTTASSMSSRTDLTIKPKEIARGFEERVAQLPPVPTRKPNVKLTLCHSKDGIRPTFQVISSTPRKSTKVPRVPQKIKEVSTEA